MLLKDLDARKAHA